MLEILGRVFEALSPTLLKWFLKQAEHLIAKYIDKSDENIDRVLQTIADKRLDFGNAHVDLYKELRKSKVADKTVSADNYTLYDLMVAVFDLRVKFENETTTEFRDSIITELKKFTTQYMTDSYGGPGISQQDLDDIFITRLAERVYDSVKREYNIDYGGAEDKFNDMVMLSASSSELKKQSFNNFSKAMLDRMKHRIPEEFDSMAFCAEYYDIELCTAENKVVDRVDNDTVVFKLIGRSPSTRGRIMFNRVMESTVIWNQHIANAINVDGYTVCGNIMNRHVVIDTTGITAFSGLMGLIMSTNIFLKTNFNIKSMSLVVDRYKQYEQIKHSLENERSTNITIIPV